MAQSNSRFELVLVITSSYFGDILISNKTFWDIVARYWKYPGDINIFWYKFAFASLLIFMPISKRSGFSDLEFRSGSLRLRREKVCKFFFPFAKWWLCVEQHAGKEYIIFRSYFGFKRLTVRIIWNQSKFQSYVGSCIFRLKLDLHIYDFVSEGGSKQQNGTFPNSKRKSRIALKSGNFYGQFFFVALAYNLVHSAPRANYCLANITFLANHTTARDAC